MKTIASIILGLASLGIITSCTTVEQREPATHTTNTTTEQRTLSHPLSNTTETRTTRSY